MQALLTFRTHFGTHNRAVLPPCLRQRPILAEYRINRKSVLDGLTDEYHIAACPPRTATERRRSAPESYFRAPQDARRADPLPVPASRPAASGPASPGSTMTSPLASGQARSRRSLSPAAIFPGAGAPVIDPA